MTTLSWQEQLLYVGSEFLTKIFDIKVKEAGVSGSTEMARILCNQKLLANYLSKRWINSWYLLFVFLCLFVCWANLFCDGINRFDPANRRFNCLRSVHGRMIFAHGTIWTLKNLSRLLLFWTLAMLFNVHSFTRIAQQFVVFVAHLCVHAHSVSSGLCWCKWFRWVTITMRYAWGSVLEIKTQRTQGSGIRPPEGEPLGHCAGLRLARGGLRPYGGGNHWTLGCWGSPGAASHRQCSGRPDGRNGRAGAQHHVARTLCRGALLPSPCSFAAAVWAFRGAVGLFCLFAPILLKRTR